MAHSRSMKKLIYIIDDDTDMREVLSYALESDGYEVETHPNALEALERLKTLDSEKYPSMILIDYIMPEMDGVSFAKIIKEQYPQTLGKIPLIISTAMLKEDYQQGLPLDILHLRKPMDLDHLLAVTKSVCS